MRPRNGFFSFALVTGVLVVAISEGCGSGGGGSDTTTGTPGGSVSSGVGGNGGAGAGNVGGNGSTGTGAGSTGTGAGSTGTGAGSSGGVITISQCQGHVYECGDTVDNDGDGLVDQFDPDCLGPCDNTEDSYFGGIPGQTGAGCILDCYFDQDSGAGNDECYWNHKCDPHEVAPNYYPESWNGDKCEYDPGANTPGTNQSCDQMYNAQSNTCYSVCGPLTPNGCDCFGCCELPAGGGKYVWLGSEDGNGNGSCNLANVGDPDKCQPCLPVKACLNTCGKCELCIGKTIADLPPECFPPDGGSSSSSAGSTSSTGSSSSSSGSVEQCDPGVQACGLPGQPPCPAGTYCITGCCQQIPQ